MSERALFDDPALASAYYDLRAQEGRPNDVVERPALQGLLLELAEHDVVDLGCGAGQMARWARSQGARSVIAVDASEQMITQAQGLPDPGIAYEVADVEHFSRPPGSVDIVMSGLTLHYVEDLPRLFHEIASWLKPGGVLAFSVEHPVMTCSARQWFESADGQRLHWPVDDYLREGPRTVSWLSVDVTRRHRTVATYVNAILDAGLRVTRMLEPGPTEAQVQRWPALKDHLRRPSFLLIAAVRS